MEHAELQRFGPALEDHLVDLVERQIDPVISDATLGKVIGADALRAIAGADLAAAVGRALGVELLAFELIEPRAQDLHRLRLVLVLRFLVLLADDKAGRKMGDAHGAVGGVDRLAAGTARPEHVDAQILVVDLDVDVLGLGQHRHGGGGGMDAALRLGLRHALHPMHAGFELEPREHALAGDVGDDLLVAAGRGFARRKDVDLPAMLVGVALIHAEEIAGEERRLLAAGAGAHLEDRALLVGGILGQQLHLELVLELLDLLVEGTDLFFGERRHVLFRGRIVDQLLQALALAKSRAERVDGGDNRIELGELPREAHIAFLVGA